MPCAEGEMSEFFLGGALLITLDPVSWSFRAALSPVQQQYAIVVAAEGFQPKDTLTLSAAAIAIMEKQRRARNNQQVTAITTSAETHNETKR